MDAGLETTIHTLSKSRNEAATATLLAALDAPDGSVFAAAVRGLMLRRSKAGHLPVLKLWPQMDESQRDLLEAGRGRIGGALRDALLSSDDTLFQTACEVADRFSEYDLVATLVNVAENPGSAHAQAATDLTLRLVSRLGDMLRKPRESKDRRDPLAVRKHVLESLERSMERFRQHKRSALVEAYVVLAGAKSTTLRSIIESPHHACFQAVLQSLTTSSSPTVIGLLIDFMTLKDAPQVVRNVVSRRNDRPFVEALLQMPLTGANSCAVANLSRISSFAFLANPAELPAQFDEVQQVQAMQLVGASSLCADLRLDLVEEMLNHGAPAGRAAAVQLLSKTPGDRSNQLTRRALDDPAPEVQATAARPLRDRHVPGVMGKLVELVASPYAEVRDAAREALSEFSLVNYLARFEALEESIRISTGRLVLQIDIEAVPGLLAELESPSRRRRMRAVRVAEAMGALPQISHALIELLEDEDHLMRATVADALQHCTGGDVRAALLAALGDRSPAVKHAAQESLEALGVDPHVVAAALAATEQTT